MSQNKPTEPLKVVDLGVGMAAALAAKMFAEFGARVSRIEPTAGDPFYGVYEAYGRWREGFALASIDQLEGLLEDADVCIVGGESFPGLDWSFDGHAISHRHSSLVVLEITGYVSNTVDATPAVDLLVQAQMGLVFEQFDEHPVCLGLPMPTYGAALMGLVGAMAALIDREGTGLGQRVSASMQQGAALFWNPLWTTAGRPDTAFDMVAPKGAPHLIFKCADGGFIQFALGLPNAVEKLYRVLGIEIAVSPTDRGIPRAGSAPRKYYADRDLLEPYVLRRNRDDLLKAFREEGLPAEPVLMPGEAWDDPQTLQNATIRRSAGGGRHVGSPVRMMTINEEAPSPAPHNSSTASPLEGLRVLDLGAFVAGPYASKLLADLGADVIKVEPLGGQPIRVMVRASRSVENGKSCICLDTKSEDGAEILRRLVRDADAVHYNFRVGVPERLGYDPLTLRRSRSDVVTLQTFAYGAEGPKAYLSGLDMVLQAFCGIEYRCGGTGNDPLWYRTTSLDYGTGALGAAAMLFGVLQRIRRGGAMELETSLLDGGLFMVSELVQTADGEFKGAPPLDAERLGFHPAERLYRTQDDWIAIAARTEDMAQRLADVLAIPDLGPRAQWAKAQKDRLVEAIATWDTEALLKRLAAADVWASACARNSWQKLRSDPAARAANLVITVPDAIYGDVDRVGPLVNFSRSPLDVTRLGTSRAGENTRQLLTSLEISEDRIDDLYARKVIG
jgi:crotonobetainyl-CoA:carnitine CoA-transferase CaiB-like acyl-CoA transferase